MKPVKKHLFLTGPDVSALRLSLQNVLGSSAALAGGFVTETCCDASGKPVSAALLPAAALGGVEGFSPLPFLDLGVTPPLHDNEVFRVEGARLLQEATWYPFSVLDALGSFELLIPQYRQALADFLSSDLPILGILLPRKESEQLCRKLGLGERVNMNIEQLWKALRADPDTQIADFSGLGAIRAQRSLEQWCREYLP